MRKIDPAKVQQQREQIIRAALKCFAHKGVHGSSTDDICRAAKVSSGTLYYYFKSRDGLIHDVIIHAHATRDPVLERLNDAPDLLDALVEAQRASTEAIAAQGIQFDVYMELLAYAQRNPASKAAFQDATTRLTPVLVAAVRAHQQAGKLPADIDPEALVRVLSMNALGMSIMAITDPDYSEASYRASIEAVIYRKNSAAGIPTSAPAKRKKTERLRR